MTCVICKTGTLESGKATVAEVYLAADQADKAGVEVDACEFHHVSA